MALSSKLEKIISNVLAFSWLPELLAGLAGILYLIQSLGFAYTQWSVLDEGNYIYKGWLFVTGQYTIYQDYGPLSNHMPFSYLIFGYVQLLFGPGLRTVRYFMVFVGCLFLLGMWFASKRLAGRWAAAAGLCFVALNPFAISVYSVAITEGLIACVLAWMLYFILGKNRSSQELFVGSFLAVLLALIRENMILLLPFVLIYMFWEHGKKALLIFLGVGGCLFLLVNILYWPGILQVWQRWIPKAFLPLFEASMYHGGGTFLWSTQSSLTQKFAIIFTSVRANFMAVFGLIVALLSWPKDGFKDRSQFRVVVFLSTMFVALYAAHAWASLEKGYCSFCLVNYLTFFSPIGLLLYFAFLPGITNRQPVWPAWLAGSALLLLIAGMSYSTYGSFGQILASIGLPRINNFQIQPGSVELWRMLANKFNFTLQFSRMALPIVAGFVIGIVVLGVGYVLTKIGTKNQVLSKPVYSFILVTVLTGLAFSPTTVFGGIDPNSRCEKDILAGYEQVGAELAQRIPVGSRVYWAGDTSPTVLLYLPGVKIYPPQLNAIYSFVLHGDTENLLRYGFWNEELQQEWLSEADIILIRAGDFASLKGSLSPTVFDESQSTAPTFPCVAETSIRIFRRK
jgi:Dolichyl-phosphate-mannose-protein mannosyltransferase